MRRQNDDWSVWRPIPWAPYFGPGGPRRGTPPRSRLDRIAKLHDEDFEAVGIKDWTGYLSPRRIPADLRLLGRILKEPGALNIPGTPFGFGGFPGFLSDGAYRLGELLPVVGPVIKWWRDL